MQADLSIIAIGDSGEARLIREIAESLHKRVQIEFIGQPAHFIKTIQASSILAELIIVSAHGDENGFVFGEFGSGIDTSMLRKGSMPVNDALFAENLAGKTIISTACGTGDKDHHGDFKSGSTINYIAPDGFPNGTTIALFIHKFLYDLWIGEQGLKIAFKNAQMICDDAAIFRLYEF